MTVKSFLCCVFRHCKGKYPELILSVVFFMRVIGKKCSVRYTCAEKKSCFVPGLSGQAEGDYEVNFIL